ncbi:serine protease FAM111A [Suncus etruscus]|uniref:serine protease FAM111A n=1 Tax=Suncus etruscus TaxID=109475 RepID=UPI002110607F|nr:serine protease FAM111A [Suncus etruscus]
MSSKNRRSLRIPFSEKSNMKLEQYFSPVNKEQTNMDSGKDLKDKLNTQVQGPEDQTKKFFIRLMGETRPIVHTHSGKSTLYEALQYVDALKKKMDPQSDKDMLVLGTEGIEAYINPTMPLSCFPDVTHLEIKFIQSQNEQKENNQVREKLPKFDTDCVKFYIHAVGKREEKIVQYRKLHKQGIILCVYGFKGETIKAAVCRDGRFLPFLENSVWKLVENLHSIVESSQYVDNLENKLFEVEFEKRKSSRAGTSQNSEAEERNICVLQGASVDLYPSLKIESEKIREKLKEEMKGAKNKSHVFKCHKITFSKATRNSTPVKVHKLLYHLSSSVGYLSWANNGNEGCATCFVFRDLYIFTCWHVVRDIVGEGIDKNMWPHIISQCVKVSFGYEEEFLEKEKNSFSLEPWFEVADESLDYAVLKLKPESGAQVPSALFNGMSPVPLNGLIYIIGHPFGEPKSTDACCVIPQSQRVEACQARQADSYVPMFTPRSFQEISENDDVITYHTSFFFGASGSPVVNADGVLVAMHSAGLNFDYQKGLSTLIEFGPTIQSILAHIKRHYPMWYAEICTNLDDEMMSDED